VATTAAAASSLALVDSTIQPATRSEPSLWRSATATPSASTAEAALAAVESLRTPGLRPAIVTAARQRTRAPVVVAIAQAV